MAIGQCVDVDDNVGAAGRGDGHGSRARGRAVGCGTAGVGRIGDGQGIGALGQRARLNVKGRSSGVQRHRRGGKAPAGQPHAATWRHGAVLYRRGNNQVFRVGMCGLFGRDRNGRRLRGLGHGDRSRSEGAVERRSAGGIRRVLAGQRIGTRGKRACRNRNGSRAGVERRGRRSVASAGKNYRSGRRSARTGDGNGDAKALDSRNATRCGRNDDHGSCRVLGCSTTARTGPIASWD